MKEITGDLIKQAYEFDVIVHGCNCMNTMNSGFAKQLKQEFNQVLTADNETKRGDRTKLGTFSVAYSPYAGDNFIIVNAYTQYRYGTEKRHCDYDAVRSCMKGIKKRFTGLKIGMPRIGANRAGGDWNIISKIIEEELAGEDVTIVNWEQEDKIPNKSNDNKVSYKWRKMFAAINHNKGKIELTSAEAQELIDDIERGYPLSEIERDNE
jgi:O-acetyl-ADP-ribose deacetylase (regulator of RNase III)